MGKVIAALACVCAALVPCGAAAAAPGPVPLIVGINDDVKYESTVPAFFMPTMHADGLKLNALTLRWDDTQPTTIDPDLAGYLTTVIGEAATAGVTVEFDLYPLHSQAFTDGLHCAPSPSPARVRRHHEDPAVRGVGGERRADVPDRAPVHRRERVQPAALPEPAMERGGAEPVGGDLRARARGDLRRAQGRQPHELRLGRRALAAGERLAERAEQLLDLAGEVPRLPRGLVQVVRSRDPPNGPADGRARLPPLSRAAVASVRERVPGSARRQHLEPRTRSTRPSTTASTTRPRRRSASSAGEGSR